MRSWQMAVIALALIGGLVYSGLALYEDYEAERPRMYELPTMAEDVTYAVAGPYTIREDGTPMSVSLTIQTFGGAWGQLLDAENLALYEEGRSYSYYLPELFTYLEYPDDLTVGYAEYELDQGTYYLVLKSYSINFQVVTVDADVGMNGDAIVFQVWMIWVAGAVAIVIGTVLVIGKVLYGGRVPPPEGRQGIGGGEPYLKKGLRGGGLFGGNRRL